MLTKPALVAAMVLLYRLARLDVETDPRAATCVVVASGGYPGSYSTGFPIDGIDRAEPPLHMLGDRLQHAGQLRVQVVDQVDEQGLRRLGPTGRAELVLPVMADDQVLHQHLQFRRELRQAGQLGDVLIPVDRVGVAGHAGVVHQITAGQPRVMHGQRIADLVHQYDLAATVTSRRRARR